MVALFIIARMLAFVKFLRINSINSFESGSKAIRLLGASAQNRNFGSTSSCYAKDSYKLVVAGGGCGGLAAAAMFSRKLGPSEVAVIDPNTVKFLILGSFKTSLSKFPILFRCIRISLCGLWSVVV